MSVEELVAELERARISNSELDRGPLDEAVLAFDADGTLWSGDVGEEVFLHFVTEGLLRTDALPALQQFAKRFGVAQGGDRNRLALSMFRAYQVGDFPEREICEMMAWCYAGWDEAPFRARVRSLFEATDLKGRLQREIAPILAWAQEKTIRVVVISASPQIVVEEAAAHWGIAPEQVVGSRPVMTGGTIGSTLASPTPYADTKPSAGRAHFGTARWLASFGDNVFDLDMLNAAEVAVLVRPKPALLECVQELRNVRRVREA